MGWKAFQIIFRVRSPVHIGWVTVGNLQRTRPYITGRVLWGAITARISRDSLTGLPTKADSAPYQETGEKVHKQLRFTYFYPALKNGNQYTLAWPWKDPALFRSRFLSSYASTALNYPSQDAAEGTLHETEFLSPYCLDTAEPVFLMGYIFEQENSPESWHNAWQSALQRLQLGGERNYGWGRIERCEIQKLDDGQTLFGSQAKLILEGEQVIIQLLEGHYLLAHTMAQAFPAMGDVEPFVGREWRSNQSRHHQIGQHVEFSGICFTPGSVTTQKVEVKIGNFGIWSKVSQD